MQTQQKVVIVLPAFYNWTWLQGANDLKGWVRCCVLGKKTKSWCWTTIGAPSAYLTNLFYTQRFLPWTISQYFFSLSLTTNTLSIHTLKEGVSLGQWLVLWVGRTFNIHEIPSQSSRNTLIRKVPLSRCPWNNFHSKVPCLLCTWMLLAWHFERWKE